MVAQAPHIGPYELVRRLGRGGMAETFVARRHGPGGFVQECCIKCVLPQFADDRSFRDQFLDEATLHGRLQHGNIVRVQDFGEHEGTYFLVMELVSGCDLAQLIAHARGSGARGLPPELAVLIAIDLCQALSYAHALETDQGPLGMVHRDLTPSNVLLNRAGEVKLSDFGIARAAQRRHRTETGFTKGKLCYMSPEQIGAAKDLDARSDLFALGIVMYEMLSGMRPFEAPSDSELGVLPRILVGEHTPLSERMPDLDPALCDLVERLLQPAREQRPASAVDVLEALAAVAPPVTARGRLAARVKEAAPASSPEQKAPSHYAQPTRTAAATPAERTSRAPGRVRTVPVARSTSGTLRPARGARWMLAVSVASALVVGGLWWDRSRRDESKRPSPVSLSSQGRDAKPVPVPPPSPSARENEATAPSAEPVEDEAAPTPEKSLTDLRVVVVPYGNIWIDGKKRGATRLHVTVPAGRHRIGIGRGDRPTRSEQVVLPPGTRTLEYELPGAFE